MVFQWSFIIIIIISKTSMFHPKLQWILCDAISILLSGRFRKNLPSDITINMKKYIRANSKLHKNNLLNTAASWFLITYCLSQISCLKPSRHSFWVPLFWQASWIANLDVCIWPCICQYNWVDSKLCSTHSHLNKLDKHLEPQLILPIWWLPLIWLSSTFSKVLHW